MRKQAVTPFNPPAKFWQNSWISLLQLIANGLLKSTLVIVSYYLIKNVSFLMRHSSAIAANELWNLALIAVGLIILRVHERYTSEKMSQKYINRIRSSLLKRIMRASIRNVQNKTVGNLSSRLAGDLSAVKRWLSLGIARLVTHTLLLVATTLLIFKINAQLGYYISFALISLISLSMFAGNRLKKSIKNVRRNRIKIHSLLVERLTSMATIRAMGKEQYEVKKINRQAKKLERNIANQGIMLGLLRGIGDAASIVLILTFFGFQRVHQNALSIDEITALISIILFLNAPIRELGRVQEYYQGAKLSLQKVQELFTIPRIVRGKSQRQKVQRANGQISINQITLQGVFQHFSATATSGEHIAIVGKNGSGKSTLLALLLGLIKPDSGQIKINGISPRRLAPSERAQHIGVCGEDIKIIKGSLLSNLSYRNSNFNQSEFDDLIKFCQLDSLINHLPQGLQTKVKENGNNFSSGEKAKISLFRALLGNPSLLILDEPENFLDASGLELIHQLLQDYKGSILIATHEAQLIQLCDRAWHINAIQKISNNENNITLLKE